MRTESRHVAVGQRQDVPLRERRIRFLLSEVSLRYSSCTSQRNKDKISALRGKSWKDRMYKLDPVCQRQEIFHRERRRIFLLSEASLLVVGSCLS